METKTKCYIKVNENLTGCYSCLGGAKLSYTCKTDKGSALAYVQCSEENTKFATDCKESGFHSTTTLTFTKAQVQEKCTVTCPGGKTSFYVSGNLKFINKKKIGELAGISYNDISPNEINMQWASSVLDWFKSNWDTLLLSIIIGIAIILVIMCCGPFLLNTVVIFCLNFKAKLFKLKKAKIKNTLKKPIKTKNTKYRNKQF